MRAVLHIVGPLLLALVQLCQASNDTMEVAFEVNERGAIFDPETGKRRYDNYQLIRVNPETDEHLSVLQFLNRGNGMVEMWSTIPYNASLVDKVDLIVSPQHLTHVKGYLSCSGMVPEVVEEDLQRAIDEENQVDPELIITRQSAPLDPYHIIQKRGTFSQLLGLFVEQNSPRNVRPGRNLRFPSTQVVQEPNTQSDRCGKTGMTWSSYHRYETIDAFITCLATEYPEKATLINIGNSFENRPMRLLKITNNPRLAKDSIWIDGGIHAREWVSPSAVTYMMKEFVENSHLYSHLLDNYDIYILPLANPDGYEYSHTRDRLWRKTRSNHNNFNCIGVDPNRNWGYNWAGQGASGDPCDETYYGPRAFSEPETLAISNFIMDRKDSMRLYLTFHSYGQYILYPWGYARHDAVDRNDLHRLGRIGAEAAQKQSGNKYSVGSAAKMLYPAAGGSDDWAKGGAGIKYSYTVELPDTGRHGFLLPSNRALNVGKEAVALTDAMISNL